MDNFISILLKMRKFIILKKISFIIMKFIGIEIPLSVKIGQNFKLEHWANGLVIHPNTTIGNNVRIYQGVTVGRADIYIKNRSNIKLVIEDNVVLCAGAKVLCKHEEMVIGNGTIVGANSVLLKSTGSNEIWAGIPAIKVK